MLLGAHAHLSRSTDTSLLRDSSLTRAGALAMPRTTVPSHVPAPHPRSSHARCRRRGASRATCHLTSRAASDRCPTLADETARIARAIELAAGERPRGGNVRWRLSRVSPRARPASPPRGRLHASASNDQVFRALRCLGPPLLSFPLRQRVTGSPAMLLFPSRTAADSKRPLPPLLHVDVASPRRSSSGAPSPINPRRRRRALCEMRRSIPQHRRTYNVAVRADQVPLRTLRVHTCAPIRHAI